MKEEIIDVDERGNLLAAESTTNYGLIKPGQDDFYNVDDFNQNMDTIDKQLKVNESQIKTLENQIQNIDVSGDVRQVINERVNADTSKPLSTLISEWVNAAKTAILNGINGLPQKSVWTDARASKLDNLNQSMTTTQTNINNTTNAARDNIKRHVTEEKNSIVNTINSRNSRYTPSNNVRKNFTNNRASRTSPTTFLGKFEAKRNGVVRVTAELWERASHVNVVVSAYISRQSGGDKGFKYPLVDPPEGSNIDPNIFIGCAKVLNITSIGAVNTWSTNEEFIRVDTGDLLFFVSSTHGGDNEAKSRNVKLYYDEVNG